MYKMFPLVIRFAFILELTISLYIQPHAIGYSTYSTAKTYIYVELLYCGNVLFNVQYCRWNSVIDSKFTEKYSKFLYTRFAIKCGVIF